MTPVLLVHVAAGTLALISGFVALYAPKGAPIHRRAGLVFVCSMLVMCSGGFLLTIARGNGTIINVPAALVTGCLVVTAFTTVLAHTALTTTVDRIATIVLLGVGLATLALGLESVIYGVRREGIPAFPYFMFSFAALSAVAGDIRVMKSGPLTGARRIARHLWRMTFALFIAAMSFFIGQADVFPERFRIMPVLALPILLILVTMLYWMWRVRIRQSLRGLKTSSTYLS